MDKNVVIGLAQINPTVGALDHNADLIIAQSIQADGSGCDVVVFPELALSGYPPEDLVLKDHFIADVAEQINRIAAAIPESITCIVGAPVSGSERAQNAAVVLRGGGVFAGYSKMMLPNYGVFDEKRVFEEGCMPCVLDVKGVQLAIHICEDSWSTEFKSCTSLKGKNIDAVLNLSASPYYREKTKEREAILSRTAQFLNAPLFYCNLTGGQDELVFDGGSCVFTSDGSVVQRAEQFHEELLITNFPTTGKSAAQKFQGLEEVYEALRLGLQDYVNKHGFNRAVIAISGGIDSALVAALAVDALGADRVIGLTMPSRYSSEGTYNDSHDLANRLGIEFFDVPIKKIHELYLEELAPLWPDKKSDTTEENLQARIRGNIVMALSNKFGWLVLTTGNKSELATGYCTLYGDMAGGFAPLKDVPKTLVYALSSWRNENTPDHPPITQTIIDRPPSAELREDQKDEDSLPPYPVLDAIIERYVENDFSAEQIVADGYSEEDVSRVIHLIDGNEYKRRQGPPGIKITPKSFGRDRRLPITNLYSERVKGKKQN